MWLPFPEIFLFHLEKARTPFKAYFTYYVSNVFFLTFFSPPWKNLSLTLDASVKFCSFHYNL